MRATERRVTWWRPLLRLLVLAAAVLAAAVVAVLAMPLALMAQDVNPDRARLRRERRAAERWRVNTLRPRLIDKRPIYELGEAELARRRKLQEKAV